MVTSIFCMVDTYYLHQMYNWQNDMALVADLLSYNLYFMRVYMPYTYIRPNLTIVHAQMMPNSKLLYNTCKGDLKTSWINQAHTYPFNPVHTPNTLLKFCQQKVHFSYNVRPYLDPKKNERWLFLGKTLAFTWLSSSHESYMALVRAYSSHNPFMAPFAMTYLCWPLP
jgi:hypothetical protein